MNHPPQSQTDSEPCFDPQRRGCGGVNKAADGRLGPFIKIYSGHVAQNHEAIIDHTKARRKEFQILGNNQRLRRWNQKGLGPTNHEASTSL